MTFHMNPNFGNELNAIHDRLDAAFANVRQDQQGQPIENVKSVLEEGFAAANDGARISDPELTTCAGALAAGKRVWVDQQTGHIMADD
ncbi:hypothetical protein JYQ29_10935 [Curtobacterium flaccumfaciens pv. flaccumfaciens]|uniref:hypothetical protein n=1 Tax=Curtobacterium flaccumfaciens TaxID=2035 RepID=UPI001AD9B907|nr:hypothetical protein [Curtobacterium flaccumfaciens]MBO9057498.1 hypothetical protein [Curtobacterium flaccumfaciens pv. flaccumfaciens]